VFFKFNEKNSNNGQSVKLVVGNTGAGVFKNDVYSVYIDISSIPDLLQVTHRKIRVTYVGQSKQRCYIW
jgi:hypothetical protein